MNADDKTLHQVLHQRDFGEAEIAWLRAYVLRTMPQSSHAPAEFWTGYFPVVMHAINQAALRTEKWFN